MSTCIVGMKRTRSSILSFSIADFYQSNNYFGKYDAVVPDLSTRIMIHRLSKDQIREAKFQVFKDHIKNITHKVINDKNSVIKLFPRYMIYHSIPNVVAHEKQVLPENYNDLQIITDIEEHFQLSKFNKIYFLERDLTDTICSYSYAIHLKKFHFLNHYELEFYKKNKPQITIDTTVPWLDFCIFEYLLLQNFRKYLDSNKIIYHPLAFEEIPSYCEKIYTGTKGKRYIDSEIDYKKTVLNYNQIEEYCQNFFDKNIKYVNENIIFR